MPVPTPSRHREIEKALHDHRPFLANVRINAFFHDLDKIFADYLRWSLLGGGGPAGDYLGHNHTTKAPDEYADLYWPTREKYIITWKGFFRQPDQPEKLDFPVDKVWLCCRDNNERIQTLSGTSRPLASWYDFAVYHHDYPGYLLNKAATALLLFTAGTAGVDGLDTQYETENQFSTAIGKRYHGHHTPETVADNKVLIATPFGHERKVAIDAAENAVPVDLAAKVRDITDCMEQAETLSRELTPAFRQTIIRTSRPINDVTLADHSLSTAALAVAQGARVALETAVRPEDRAIRYCLPTRNISDDPETPCGQTGFAVFTCAVNSGMLDAMALELKDITAIREEVQKLFDVFVRIFTHEYPVGGEVYRDQHGVHVIVPMLGDPTRRWVVDDQDGRVRWLKGGAKGISCLDFVEWLFHKTREALKADPILFGRELLVGCRYAPVLKKLNRLAKAIDWSREISFLSMAADRDGDGEKTRFFKPCDPQPGKISDDLCGICSLQQGNRTRKHRKCDTCEQRVQGHRVSGDEIGDIEKLARYSSDNRMALLSVGFDLANWLAEETNSGIFSFSKKQTAANLNKERQHHYQRYNSFGRFRRIWRTTTLFMEELREEIQGACKGESGQPYRMRTIFLQPQDMQIILPANLAGKALNLVYEKFSMEFGRVNGRMPFHVSLCIFPFRAPVYLVLDGARRLKESCLQKKFRKTTVRRREQNTLCRYQIRQTDTGRGPWGRKRKFTHPMPLTWVQEFQPGDVLEDFKGNDYFHANIMTALSPPEWKFAGDFSGTDCQTVYMVDNRLAIVEINSGFCLDELSVLSEDLDLCRCHDIPLDYWPQIKKLLRLESRISLTQRRRLRSIIAHREKLWRRHDLPGPDEPEKEEFLRRSMETLWRDPSRFGPGGWETMEEDDRNLLVESCMNGALFLASMVEKRLLQT